MSRGWDDLLPATPTSWVCLLGAILWAVTSLAVFYLWVSRSRLAERQAKRRRQGLCPVCGYDLRASPHYCPECGSPVPANGTAPIAEEHDAEA